MSTADAVPTIPPQPATAAPAAAAAVGAAAPGGAREKTSTSLWVGDLAPEVTEAILSEMFSTIASVQSARVCRSTVTRESLGYAYVNFMTPEDAQKAMEELNYAPIKGRPCRIMFSQRDPALRRSNVGNLFIKNLDPEITSRDLHDAFKLFGTLLSVKVATDRAGLSKGYGFVHFDTEAAAKAAIDGTNGMQLGANTVKVENYLPKAQRGGQDRWTNVFVKNLPKAWSKEKFQEVFAPFGEITSIALPTREGESAGHGFVNYKEHEMAVKAVEEMHNKVLEGEEPVAPPRKEVEAAAAAAAEGGAPAPVLAPRPPKLYCARFQRKVDRQRAQKEKAETLKRERIVKFQGCNLYVRNLEETMDDAALRKEFEPFGAIQSARVAMEDGRSKCFGFVCYSTPDEANRAREQMNRKPVGASQKPLHVVLWEPKDARVARQAQAAQSRSAAPVRGQNPAMAPGFGLPQAAGFANMNYPFMQMLMQMMMNPQLFHLMMNASPDLRNRSGGLGGPRAGGMPGQMGAAMGANPNVANLGGRGPAGLPVQGAPYPPGGAFPGAAGGYGNQAAMAAAMNAAAMQLSAGGQAPRGGMPGAPGGRSPRGVPPGPGGVPPPGPGGIRVGGGPGGPLVGAGGPGVPGAPGAPGVPRGAGGPLGMPAGVGARPAMGAGVGAGAAGARALPGAPRSDAKLSQTMLAAAPPAQRKNLIGEQLYAQISRHQPGLAGKITGMLLEGMDEAELIFLIETPEELINRIREAMDVLDQHKKSQQ
jgi:polyadenylate-binding protein